jgi:hypothetical protein
LNPIPTALRETFFAALFGCADWRSGEPEPEIGLDLKAAPISLICDLVTACKDEPLPADYLRILDCMLDERLDDLRERFDKNRSYHAAAHCLRVLFDDKKERFSRNETEL